LLLIGLKKEFEFNNHPFSTFQISWLSSDNKYIKLMDIKRFGLASFSGVLLALSYPSYNLYYLQWVAFIPLLFSLKDQSIKSAYIQGVITGFWGICIGFYWIANWSTVVMEIAFPLNYGITIAHSLAVAQIFGIIFSLFQWVRKHFPDYNILTLPLIFVAIFTSFPTIFKFSLGDAQSYFLPAIQLIEFTGVYGLDFIIILVNIVLYSYFNGMKSLLKKIQIVTAILIIFIWFFGGWMKLNTWDQKIKNWDLVKVGIIQTNSAASMSKSKPSPPYSRSYPLEMALSEELASQNPVAIIWPEGNFFGITFWSSIKTAFLKHVSKLKIPLILHDITISQPNGQRKTYNSSVFFPGNGEGIHFYHKMIRVPFGEYVPFIDDFWLLKKLLGSFITNLNKGESHKIFDVINIRFVPKICYESLFPSFVAESINQDGQGKVLLVQSQDGWYGESSAAEQHLASSALRAVENRVPLIHVINNGSSGIISPNGRYEAKLKPFRQVSKVISFHFDSNAGGSFFSAYPYFFLNSVRMLFLMLIFSTYWMQYKSRSIEKSYESNT
jgi:apolipoprotein N-acyltransferase